MEFSCLAIGKANHSKLPSFVVPIILAAAANYGVWIHYMRITDKEHVGLWHVSLASVTSCSYTGNTPVLDGQCVL
jgi:hypothetical protein